MSRSLTRDPTTFVAASPVDELLLSAYGLKPDCTVTPSYGLLLSSARMLS